MENWTANFLGQIELKDQWRVTKGTQYWAGTTPLLMKWCPAEPQHQPAEPSSAGQGTQRELQVWEKMIGFFLYNSRALLPTFVSFCPDVVSICREYHHQPLFFTQLSQTPFWVCTYTKHPQPHSKNPNPLFLAWSWKRAKWTTVWAKWTLSGQNVWKVGKKFLEVGKKILFIERSYAVLWSIRNVVCPYQLILPQSCPKQT